MYQSKKLTNLFSMNRKLLASLMSLVFAFSTGLIPANAAVKAGSTCKTAGLTFVVSGKTFTCIKSGKKLVWDKGVAVSKTIAYSVPSQPSSNINLCKITENNSIRRGMQNVLATGFPSVSNLAQKTGTVKWALVPIDFSDIPGEANFRDRVNNQMLLLSEWFNSVSEGKFKVEWVVADKWTTLPGKSSDYKIPFSDSPDRSPAIADFWTKAITETDKSFDYTNIQTVNFILPLSQTVVNETLQGFPWDQAVKNYVTKEGKVSSFSIPGVFMNQLNRQYWSYWAHEFGHAMAMAHIGSSRVANPYNGLDLMSNQDGYTRELSGWMRFVAGWLDDERVYCQELSKLGNTEITLVPLSSTDMGLKMTVIPVTESKAVIVESRRETKFSCKMPTKKNGVLIYLYDATIGNNDNFLIPVTPTGRSDEGSSDCPVSRFPDPLLYKGQKINVEGVTIEVLESLNYDQIRITK
jgi:M6 family metalloprotease-like protein